MGGGGTILAGFCREGSAGGRDVCVGGALDADLLPAVGYFYNLFTLIPILDLEGGWIAPAIAPQRDVLSHPGGSGGTGISGMFAMPAERDC